MRNIKATTLALGLTSAFAFCFTPAAQAAPLPSQVALKQAAPSHTTDVHWRGGWGWGPGIGFGLAAGALTAAAIASSGPWGWGYPAYSYDYYPAYSYGYYPAYRYSYAPATYAYEYDYAPTYSYGYSWGPSYAYVSGPRHWRGGRYWRGSRVVYRDRWDRRRVVSHRGWRASDRTAFTGGRQYRGPVVAQGSGHARAGVRFTSSHSRVTTHRGGGGNVGMAPRGSRQR